MYSLDVLLSQFGTSLLFHGFRFWCIIPSQTFLLEYSSYLSIGQSQPYHLLAVTCSYSKTILYICELIMIIVLIDKYYQVWSALFTIS